MNQEAALLVERLELSPHPEGGFYKETYRAPQRVHSSSQGGERCAFTSIYFLLADNNYSAWHRVKSDESWFFHTGGDLAVYSLVPSEAGVPSLKVQTLGLSSGRFELTVPGGTWFAAKPVEPNSYVLVSCVVAPGFEFEDFELADREMLTTFGGEQMDAWPLIQSLLIGAER